MIAVGLGSQSQPYLPLPLFLLGGVSPPPPAALFSLLLPSYGSMRNILGNTGRNLPILGLKCAKSDLYDAFPLLNRTAPENGGVSPIASLNNWLISTMGHLKVGKSYLLPFVLVFELLAI